MTFKWQCLNTLYKCHDTDQSDEAHRSTAISPARMLWTVSAGTSGLSRNPTTCLMTPASRKISPMTTHHSRQPASMKTCSRYLTQAHQRLVSIDSNCCLNVYITRLHRLTAAAPDSCAALYWPAPWRCAPALIGWDWGWRNSRPPSSNHHPPWSWSQWGPWLNRCCTPLLIKK